ncbi:YceI family protein [Sulfuriferula sp. GW1]|uniref:YceI family protein n=1 Tax=Sulfuriferula sp. GW1 TaxID=3345111 RepID=UPI0039B000CD
MNALMKKIGLLAGMLALWASCSAQAVEFNQLQTDKSAVSFVYKQMNVPIEGSFKRFHGLISFDPAKPALAQAEIDIDLASIDAGSDEANDEVAGKLWFNTKAFPVARFVATSITPLGNNRFEVAGKMSIKGRTHDERTVATFQPQGSGGVFAGSLVLKRADYGIGEGVWADFGTVANDIQIKFRLVAAATAVSKK